MVTIDKELEWLTYSPTCAWCSRGIDAQQRTCAAFPGGIPMVIWNREYDHRKPYPGDNGIQFEPVDKGEEA